MKRIRTSFVASAYVQQLRSAPLSAPTVHLKEAAQRLSDHFMDRAKTEPPLYEDIMRAGLGEPLAVQRMKMRIAALVHDCAIVVDEATLYEHGDVTECLFANICGAGPIEDIRQQPDVEEVQVIGKHIFVVQGGVSKRHARTFDCIEDVRIVQDRLSLCGKKPISERQPVVHSYLWNRSRLVMTREPYSDVPSIHIRNFIVKDCSLDALVSLGTIDDQMAQLLRLLVLHHASIVIGGGTNTGKTTMLFALASEIPEHERIRTLETDFEIALRERLRGARNILALRESTEAQLTMERAFVPMLLMSPEWIVVGEVKGAEAAQLIQGALRGHDVLGTMHTKYRQALLSDIVDMMKMDGRAHDEAMCRRRIARAIDIVVFVRRVLVDGVWRRVVTEISEVYVNEADEPCIAPLVVWDHARACWNWTGATLSASLREHVSARGAQAEAYRELGVWS